MKVRSPLAEMDIGIGEVQRTGNDLVLRSDSGSSMDAVITVSAREVLRILRLVLSSSSGLVFVFGLPFFWLRQTLGRDESAGTAADSPARRTNINKPW